MTAERLPLWMAPSGRLHHLRSCSGGGAHRMVRVRLTREEVDRADVCRCVVWAQMIQRRGEARH